MTIPNSTPDLAHAMNIEDMFALANGLGTIETPEQEAAADQLLDDLRKARKAADDSRKDEAKPFDDGKADVQARYNPILKRADIAADAIKAALTPYRTALQKARDVEAKRLRDDAEKLANEARAAMQSDDLDDRLSAEMAIETARRAETAANKIDRQAKGLRTSWEAEITDPVAFGRWAWANRREEYMAFLEVIAKAQARGSRTNVPGIIYHERQTAI